MPRRIKFSLRDICQNRIMDARVTDFKSSIILYYILREFKVTLECHFDMGLVPARNGSS